MGYGTIGARTKTGHHTWYPVFTLSCCEQCRDLRHMTTCDNQKTGHRFINP